ncbi:ribosomal protein S12 methylthiotransferase [Porphyromonas macacae]|uniref:Ribosomal protein uS12 methylthiotransferase RimO n=1 Tax=Porphyromonas macacae TaxID=28115 RepID=A0A0A2E0W0_9PORP|nr:30S ribosomal protein S12 methylthiotransferase RimO [Porphyromonas macacae]KGN72451.1 ribosomal protein S12 methylthiotransferase [Porphyromonas macacae]
MKRNEIDVITLGCSKNLVDSEALIRQFLANGFTVKHNPEQIRGEIVVLNTCGFIADAQEESVNMILNLVEAKKSGIIGRLYVMGCLSERFREDLKKEIPEVDFYYGKFDWKDLLDKLGKSYYADARLAGNPLAITTPSHYSYLKISEGCDRHCSYCAIPLITGKHKSRSMQDILTEARRLADSGIRELLLIAQDLTYYGLDLNGKHQLPELVERLSDIKGLDWIRLHYAYPTHFPFDILRVIRERENVCKYLDLALQHISDHMLKKMCRNITKQQTLDVLAQIRGEVPGIALRTTLMTGHPDETEEDFLELLDFVNTQKFDRLGAFVYSHEKDTYCDKHYADNVPFEVKQQRLDKLMSLQEEIVYGLNRQKIGQRFKVIIDRNEDEFDVGRTEYDSPEVDQEVLIRASDQNRLFVGEFYEVEIEDCGSFDLFGKVVE